MMDQVVPLMIWVALGGAVGSMARAGLSQWLTPRWTAHWVILAVNLSGSLAIGLIFAATTASVGGIFPDVLTGAPPAWVFGALGILGGYTTVSTLALQIHMLWTSGQQRVAGMYLALSAIGGPVLAGLGYLAGAAL